MSIPALSTADKLFICSYIIGSDIDHRKALGIINEITTFTNEYIDGFCWIPIRSPQETNNHSWYWDEADKDIVYVKVGVRVSADGYLHAWLLDTQKVSELILWNNAYNETNSPPNDRTTLHWCIEKLYRLAWGSTTGFNASNIKFQNYISGATRLYLFGNYSNSLSNSVEYTINLTNVKKSSVTWYPNNSAISISDYLILPTGAWSKTCTSVITDSDKWANFSASSFGKSPEQPEPLFYWHESGVSGSVTIPSVCNPTDPTEKTWDYCHITYEVSGFATGNNSGRSYPLYEGFPGTACTGKGYTDCGDTTSEQKLRIDYVGNRAYIEDPPGVYSCDPSFTYDTSASFTTGQWRSISATDVDYPAGDAHFSTLPIGTTMLGVYYIGNYVIDTFSEFFNNDLDELKHFNYSVGHPTGTSRLLTIFTKHVGLGLLTDAAVTIDTADWTVLWGAATYFSNWQNPDGLALRIPGTPNTPYTRPITHHDEFNVVSGQPVLGGFLYEPATSNAFLSRDPGTETKIVIPVSNNADFDFTYKLVTSDAFLSRNPGTEVKITFPVSNRADFNFLTNLLTSNGFLSRDPGTETKIEFPISNNADFSFLFKLIKSPFFDRYHLKTTGDDTKDGLSWANAWKHWTYSMQNVPDEGYLFVEEGTYNDAETQVEPDHSIVIDLRKNGLDAVSTVTITL